MPPPDFSSPYVDVISNRDRVRRAVWKAVWLLTCRWTPRFAFGWRRMILRCFGAKLSPTARVYPDVTVWAPWNLIMGEHATLGEGAYCYSMASIRIEDHVVVSQYAFLCTASHAIDEPGNPIVTAPITLKKASWIFAQAFIGPGVTVGEGAIVGARAVVMKDVPTGTIVAGNPARPIRKRKLHGQEPPL